MATETIPVRNTLNGQVAYVRPAILDNPHLAKHLVRIETGESEKPMVLLPPSTAEEFTERRKTRRRRADETTTETEEG